MTVREIKESASNFISKGEGSRGVKMYCHHFVLEDDDKVPYLAQVCETSEIQNWCNIGDTMEFMVKKYAFDIHTIEFLSRDGKRIAATAHLPGEPKPLAQAVNEFGPVKEIVAAPVINIPPSSWNNKAIALFCSATFFIQRYENANEGETVLSKAAEFEAYLNQ